MKGFTVVYCLCVVGVLSGCVSPRVNRSPAVLTQAQAHQKIAVLPFQVRFSQTYLEDLYRRRNRSESFEEFAWEHQRAAGLELQAAFFKQVSKQAQKGKIGIICLDFLQTNRLYAEGGIPMIDLYKTPKNRIAQVLGVDAVVFGETVIEMDRRMMGWGGVESRIELYDTRQGNVFFREESTERFNRPMDTPAYLANTTVAALARKLPYSRVGQR